MSDEVRITGQRIEFYKDGWPAGEAMLSTRPPFEGSFGTIEEKEWNFNNVAYPPIDPDAPRFERPQQLVSFIKFDKDTLEDRPDIRAVIADELRRTAEPDHPPQSSGSE